MAKTIYASSRALSVPDITTASGGTIAAGTYYFWLVRRTRGGYTLPSPVKSLTVAANGTITIASSNFNTLSYEGIHETLISVSTTNDYTTSRVIYKFNHFAADYITPTTPTNVIITANNTINGATTYNNPSNVSALTGLLTGYRIQLNSNGFVYEYSPGATDAIDNVTILTLRWTRREIPKTAPDMESHQQQRSPHA